MTNGYSDERLADLEAGELAADSLARRVTACRRQAPRLRANRRQVPANSVGNPISIES
jgi:hypothetical protein